MTNTKFIKVTKVDNDYFETKINGTEEEIINYYNEHNCFCDDEENKQVKEITFYYNDGGFSGTQQRKVIYPFTVDQRELYQY